MALELLLQGNWVHRLDDKLVGRELLQRGGTFHVTPQVPGMYRHRAEAARRAAQTRKDALDANVATHRAAQNGGAETHGKL